MKKKLFNILFAGACIAALASCDDNSWNNEHLKGFDDDPAITDVQSIEYTLTDADYANIASNATNQALAGEENANALKAVGSQHYFTDIITAKDYIPAYLGDSKFPYFVLDNGSAIKVTYNVATNLPEEITAAAAASQYEVTDADYQAVWGSEEDFISAFAPSHTATKNIPSILDAQYPDAQAGQYVIVNYKTSSQEPVFTTVDEGDANYTHVKAATIVTGKKYVLVAEGKAATAIEGKAYGYLGATDVTVEGEGLNLADAAALEFAFVSTEGGYNIIDANGNYLYQKGTYNSFNLSAELPAEGAVWTVETKADGSMKITNTLVGKTIQYDTQYNSYGSYADERGITPVAYEKYEPYTHAKATSIVSGAAYVMVAEGKAATAIEGKAYGYLGATDVTVEGEGLNLADAAALEFVFVATEGGYNIIDANGNYLYQKGTYNSFNLSAELPAEGAVWTVEAKADGSMKITNTLVGKAIQYDTQYNSYGSYADERGVTPVLYQSTSSASSASYSSRAVAAEVPAVKENAVYYFDGSSWSVPANFAILNPADYTAMGQNYGNLSTSANPEEYLPVYLKNKFPYAQAEDTKFVLYKYYDGSATYYRCDQYVFDGSTWSINTGIVEESAQFVKNNGKWMFDPNVTITLPNGGSHEICKLYYQTCVDWVFENIDKPLGSSDIKSGKGYVTSYGNNEYYCGTSAYYGNVDIRPDKAVTQYPAGYENMTNDEIVNLMKDRFCNEVMPAALAILHPDAMPIDGLQVVYSIEFAVYTGSTEMHTVRYEVVAPGQFEFIDCTWYEKM